MKEDLRFNWLDVLRAPRMALSLQKICILFPPLLAGYLWYILFSFLALQVMGVYDEAWESSGLLSCVFSYSQVGFWAWVLWLLAIVGLLATALFAGSAIARATYLELKGETFFTYKELYKFAVRYIKSVLLGPAGILAVIAGIVVSGLVVGLIGRIPAVGVVPAVGFVWLWFPICFFLIILGVVFFFSLLFAPPITATTRGDFFEVITETFSLVFSQLYRTVWYQLVLWVVAGFAVSVLGYLVKLAYWAMGGILYAGMGQSYSQVNTKASDILSDWFPALAQNLPSLGIHFKLGYLSLGASTATLPSFAGAVPVSQAATGWLGFWGYVLAIMAAVAGFLVVCYGIATVTAGSTIAYVVLRKIKDEDDLLEWEEEEEEEEEKPEAKKEEEEKKEAPKPPEGTGEDEEKKEETPPPEQKPPEESAGDSKDTSEESGSDTDKDQPSDGEGEKKE